MARRRNLSDLKYEYFVWLCDNIGETWDDEYGFKKLLSYLHDREFTYSIPRDVNRAKDGEDLRSRFSERFADQEESPCSVLEMMVGLAIRCEETIMDNTRYGNRTSQWFWKMINSLGLSGMYNDIFDVYEVEDIVTRFLDRKYKADGRGGLFTIRNCDTDLRDEEIWVQMNWYLNEHEDY